VFAGFAAFEDPPKPSAAEAVRALAASGVTVKVVTGDNELVTQHVCTELACRSAECSPAARSKRWVTRRLQRAPRTSLSSAASPHPEEPLIHALRSRRHVVGYLGDGINDAPSLHTADVGLSVDGAVDVAGRRPTDPAGPRPDGGSPRALEGRRTFGNIMKYVMMGRAPTLEHVQHGGRHADPAILPMLPSRSW